MTLYLENVTGRESNICVTQKANLRKESENILADAAYGAMQRPGPPQEEAAAFAAAAIERVTGRKARGLQIEEIGCKCQTFLSLLSGSNIFPSLYKFKRRFLLKCCVAMTPGFTC